MVSIESYPRKSITTVLVIYFILGSIKNIVRVFIGIPFTVPYQLEEVSRYSSSVFEKFFLFCMTLGFYCLADFKNQTNTKKKLKFPSYQKLNDSAINVQLQSSTAESERIRTMSVPTKIQMSESLEKKLSKRFKVLKNLVWAWQYYSDDES